MKLGTLKSNRSRDGELIVVSRDNQRAVRAGEVAASLRDAVERWVSARPALEALSARLNAGEAKDAFAIEPGHLHAPLPRAFQWADGSAFLHHIKLVRQARGAPLPETLETTPLMYQGGGDTFLGPHDDIPQVDFAHGTDFEGEFGVITDDVPIGISPADALAKILLVVVINDVSLRGLIPEELAQGFGFFQSKPSSAFAPFAVTPDELGPAWRAGRVHLPLNVEFNGAFFGNPDGGAMHFDFGQLIAHAARTRPLGAGTIIGSGTVSNDDPARGSTCLAERRTLEKIRDGVITTPFMKVGDRVKMEVRDHAGVNVFGTLEQTVAKV